MFLDPDIVRVPVEDITTCARTSQFDLPDRQFTISGSQMTSIKKFYATLKCGSKDNEALELRSVRPVE